MSLLEVRGIRKAFGGLQAVRDVSFDLAEGEILGLIGPNGAGKTTLFGILSGFIPADAGEARFLGQDLLSLRPHEIARRGLVRTFQIVRPFPRLSVLENVVVAALNRTGDPHAAGESARAILQRLGLAEKGGWPASTLTLADRKRLELARALAAGPRLLLLDEVMAGLNPTETGRLLGLLRQIHGTGVSLLLIEHVMHAVMQLAHRILVLCDGQIIAEGDPAAVSRDPVVIEAYLGQEYAAEVGIRGQGSGFGTPGS